MTDEVIVIAPNGQVFTFASLTKARATLLSKYYPFIIDSAQTLADKKDLYELRVIIRHTLGMTKVDNSVVALMEINNRVQLAQELWPILIAHGRKTIHMAFNKNLPESGQSSASIMYYCDYTPGEDETLDLSYLRLTPQAKVLVDMFVEKIKPFGKEGVPEHVFIKCLNDIKDELRTRQRPWAIFNYYRRQLIARGFIDIIKPRGRR